ncbi:MAG TPA: TonB-dependent receptor [Bacteroidales bacterium]|nr:TonB-dependent receptor [Bacteroidales bacterium]
MRRLICFIVFLAYSLTVVADGFQEKGSVIRGKVTDREGNGLAGAAVTVGNKGLGTHTGSDGHFIISGLKDGKYTLRVSFIGYRTFTRDLDLKKELVMDVVLIQQPFLTQEVLVNATRAGEHSPLAYSVIQKDAIREQNTGQDMPYLLSLTPSLVETSEAGNGVGYTNLRIRGTDANRINVTIDGIPLNDPESQQVFWVDLPDLASSVENIQVQRGAGTSSNGSGAFGATISIETTNPGNEPFAEVSSSAGSFNTLKNMVAAGTGLINGKFALQMRLSDLKSDGYIDRTGSDHRSAFINGIFRTDKSSLKLNILLGQEHTGIGWWGVPQDSLVTNRKYNPAGEYTDDSGIVHYYDNESDNYEQDHFQLIYGHTFSDAFSLNAALHYTRGKGYYEEYAEDQPLVDYGLVPFITGDSLISTSDLVRRLWLANDFYGLVYSVRYQKNRLEAVAGGGANLYNGDHYGNIIWMQNAGETPKGYRWYFNTGKKEEISIYGKVNFALSGSLNAFGDLQYRYVYYRMAGPDADFTDLTQKHSYGFFNPKAGLFWSVTPEQDAYLSFSVAHREPTREDYKEASGDPLSTPHPETLYDTELGYKLRKGKSLFGVNLYAMLYKDQLVPTGQLSSVGYSIMTNVDKSYRIGIETSADIRLAKIVNWNLNLTLSSNKINSFTEYYTDYNTGDWTSQYMSRDLGTVDIAYSPTVIFSSDFQLDINKWTSCHIISKYVGKQYFDNTMSAARTIDPYFVNKLRLDLSPRIKNVKGLEIQLIVNNIFNSMYENNAYGGNWYENGVEKTWSYYFPQAGTNYMCRLDIRF